MGVNDGAPDPPVLVRASGWSDELAPARQQWQNESEKLALHFLRVLFWLPAVLLPLLVLEPSLQLWRQSSERVKLEEVDELVEAVTENRRSQR